MGQALPSKHNAVVPRSHFNQLRALLVVALIAVIGLTVTVVVLASQEDQGRLESAPLARGEHQLQSSVVTGSRSDGAAEEGAIGKDYSKNAATGDTAVESQNGPGARTD